MTENEQILIKLQKEMENIRELYIKGFIDKEVYQKETRELFEVATRYGA